MENNMEEMTEEMNNNVTINEVDYAMDDLSDKAKNLISFIKKLDDDLAEHRFSMDKSFLARTKVVEDLVQEVENPEDVEEVTA